MTKVKKMVQYGGALYSRLCPKCDKEAKPQKSLSVNVFMNEVGRKIPHTVSGRCHTCGFIRLPFLGFEKEN